jgi:hypothetical protein
MYVVPRIVLILLLMVLIFYNIVISLFVKPCFPLLSVSLILCLTKIQRLKFSESQSEVTLGYTCRHFNDL